MAKLKRYPLDWSQVDVAVFRSGGKGGQHQNKVSTGVRVVHRETGVRAEARDSRSQSDNKQAAFARLQEKLDRMLQERHAEVQRAAYAAKPAAGFGTPCVRVVRIVGNQQHVTDPRTGQAHPNVQAYLDGDLDRFLAAQLRARE